MAMLSSYCLHTVCIEFALEDAKQRRHASCLHGASLVRAEGSYPPGS